MGDPNIDRIRLNSGFITAAGKESRKDPVYGTKSPSTRSLFFFSVSIVLSDGVAFHS